MHRRGCNQDKVAAGKARREQARQRRAVWEAAEAQRLEVERAQVVALSREAPPGAREKAMRAQAYAALVQERNCGGQGQGQGQGHLHLVAHATTGTATATATGGHHDGGAGGSVYYAYMYPDAPAGASASGSPVGRAVERVYGIGGVGGTGMASSGGGGGRGKARRRVAGSRTSKKRAGGAGGGAHVASPPVSPPLALALAPHTSGSGTTCGSKGKVTKGMLDRIEERFGHVDRRLAVTMAHHLYR